MKGKQILVFAFTIVFIVIAAQGASETDGAPFPLPNKAKEVWHHQFGGGDARQTSYIVDASYPDSSVGQFYLEKVKSPWVRCFEAIPKWDSFGDSSKGKARFVHQILMHWINRREKKSLLVALHYYSPGTSYREYPENTTQYVTVVEYAGQDPEETVKWLNLKCQSK